MKTIIKQEEVKNLEEATLLNSYTKEQIEDIIILSAIESGSQNTYEIQKFIKTEFGGEIYEKFLNSKNSFGGKQFGERNCADRYIQRKIAEVLKNAGEEISYKNGCTIDSETYEYAVESVRDMSFTDILAIVVRSHSLYDVCAEYIKSKHFRQNNYFNMSAEKQHISLTYRKGQHDLCFTDFMGEFSKTLGKLKNFLSALEISKLLYENEGSDFSSEKKKIKLELYTTAMKNESYKKLQTEKCVTKDHKLNIGDYITIGPKAVFKIDELPSGKVILYDIFKKRHLYSAKFNDVLELKIYLLVIEKLTEEIAAKMNVEKKKFDFISTISDKKFTLKL